MTREEAIELLTRGVTNATGSEYLSVPVEALRLILGVEDVDDDSADVS